MTSVGPDGAPRSVVFLHPCYYNFFYLARALRDRGWHALSVTVDAPTNPDLRFAHGEDVSLYDPDPAVFRTRVDEFLAHVRREVRMVHFYGRGRMSFRPEHWDVNERYDRFPEDFADLRRRGIKIGYSHSGCLDMVSQTTFHRWSRGCCDRCVWQDRPDVCSDERNLAWGRKVRRHCDLICSETDPVLDAKSGPKLYREPLTFALDPEVWRPDLEIPPRWVHPRVQGEVVVHHAVGNLSQRSSKERNVKGTPALIAAVESLRRSGFPVRLDLVTDVLSRDMRFLQAQADVIVDQLHYGRYGATAREAMMLGKPTVCLLDPREEITGVESRCLLESPIVSASAETIEAVLRDLIRDPGRRRRLGEEGRAHALRWWSAPVCAERFERVYDRLARGLHPSDPTVPDALPEWPDAAGAEAR